jgi:hypothetical protein
MSNAAAANSGAARVSEVERLLAAIWICEAEGASEVKLICAAERLLGSTRIFEAEPLAGAAPLSGGEATLFEVSLQRFGRPGSVSERDIRVGTDQVGSIPSQPCRFVRSSPVEPV